MNQQKLTILGLKDQEVGVFIYLLKNGPKTAGEIAKKIGVARPSLYGYLKNLIEKGLVTQSQRDGVKLFISVDEEKVKQLLDQKILEFKEAKANIAEIFQDIKKGNKPVQSPVLRLFEGEKAVRISMSDPLLYQHIETKSYWPMKSMLETLGVSFFKQHNDERVRRNISIQAIWPEKQKVETSKYPFLGSNDKVLRDVRIAPLQIDFTMGYWIYGNKVLFVSSPSNMFSFILECDEFAKMMSSQFDTIWKVSKKK